MAVDVPKDNLSIIFSKLVNLKAEKSNSIHLTIDMLKGYYLMKIPKTSTDEGDPLEKETNEGEESKTPISSDFVNDYSEEIHRFCYDLLTDEDCKTVQSVSSLFSNLAKHAPYNSKMIEYGMVTDLNNLIQNSAVEKRAPLFRILIWIYRITESAQKIIIELGAVTSLVEKYVEMLRYLNSKDFIDGSQVNTGGNIGGSANFTSMVSFSPEAKKSLEQKEIVEQFVMLFKDFFASHPQDSIQSCYVLTIVAESESGQILVRELFFSTVIDLENLIISSLNETSLDDPDGSIQKQRNVLNTNMIALLESLLQSSDGSLEFYNKGGFNFITNIIQQAKDSTLLPRFCDILVLLSLNDDNTEKIFENKDQLNLILSWLDSELYTKSCSAALVIGNTTHKKERSEFFGTEGVHKKLLNTINKLLESQEELGQDCSSYLMANLSCLKNILVPQACRKSVVDSSNESMVFNLLVKLCHYSGGMVVSRALMVTTKILSCNAENICVKLGDNDNYLKQLTVLMNSGDNFGVSTEATRIALLIGTFSSSTKLTNEILTEEFFASLKKDQQSIQTLLTEFANFVISSMARKNERVIDVMCSSGLLSFMTEILTQDRIPFPFLYSILSLFHHGITNGYKDKLIGFLKTPKMETQLEKFAGLKQGPLNKIIEELMKEIKN